MKLSKAQLSNTVVVCEWVQAVSVVDACFVVILRVRMAGRSGKTTFPKLAPVCLRACFDRHLQSSRAKDAVLGMKSEVELLGAAKQGACLGRFD
jgi:hypothetical protein